MRAGRRVVGERAARVEGRRDRVERPAPGAVGVVVGLEAGLPEELLGEVGRGRALLQSDLLRGGPGLLGALGVGADDGARGRDLLACGFGRLRFSLIGSGYNTFDVLFG